MENDLIKQERMPTVWCAGCGLHVMLSDFAKVFAELNMDHTNTAIIAGIGCTGRAAGYFKVDTIHGCHGRAVPVAEGLKKARPDMNVLVFSGDGDLAGIGGNHLLHSARRGANITVVCNSNKIYGLTGGQMSPTTPKGAPTVTSPSGTEYEPIDMQAIILANKKVMYCRTSFVHREHMAKCMKQALAFEGFAFVEVLAECLETFGKRQGRTMKDIVSDLKNNFKIVEGKDRLEADELGIVVKK
ncbi:2-oxoacid:ferredoxin oxidoreductase subunit beta [Candidatus Woesearchaeota archaeon]|nr:2-oxoacid:ferredoxin oxidoreductase subunit beta [Candidatus Woesearchaeota archaeon]